MKKFVILTVVGLMAVAATGQEGPRERRGAGPASRPGRQDAHPGARLQNLVKELGLSDAQTPQVQQILETHRQAVENWRKEHGETARALGEQIEAAHKAGDREKAKTLREQLSKEMTSRKELHENLMKQLSGVLNEDQMKKVRERFHERLQERRQGEDRPRRPVLDALMAAGLSDEQKVQARKIMDDAHAKAKEAQNPEDKARIIREAVEKVRTEVLTEEQRKKLVDAREQGRKKMAEALGLTEEQQKKLEALREEFRKKFEAAKTPEEKKAVAEAHRKALEQILTPEQLKKFQEMRGNFRDRRGPGRGEGPRRGGRGGPADAPAGNAD
ncbi:MAG TPA: Spy/CpxP family protein refolding chaperone [Phycisphaerae bacterium]|nr:Spy/CpxP family protein refolding chaperone [Phycisphaerae bacterium]